MLRFSRRLSVFETNGFRLVERNSKLHHAFEVRSAKLRNCLKISIFNLEVNLEKRNRNSKTNFN